MSLINREALLSYADLWASCGEHYTAEDVIMMIKTAPTVDAVPVARCGECKKKDKKKCPSECKTLGSPHWKWCPICGCRMDLEGDNHA